MRAIRAWVSETYVKGLPSRGRVLWRRAGRRGDRPRTFSACAFVGSSRLYRLA